MVVEAEGQPSSEAVAANWERPLAETVESAWPRRYFYAAFEKSFKSLAPINEIRGWS